MVLRFLNVGCKPKLMKPETIAFLCKQFSQSIFRYHLDNIFINEKSLKEFDIRQNILIKRFIGLIEDLTHINCTKYDLAFSNING
ncbi:hypothetical protein BpHYR1_024759 [Brachionus plicatilis]|uniref:Uncharacterized protein n=1 Tax=Brachionus plicatilis TaxID=10195 RepID=A0A3M7PKJ8_BRAPC|nr:hypothetical protein BpHYR1_024759 [Brachionus plicatilis]